MSQAFSLELHRPFVRELVEGGDWAALVRYWMAHQHEPALVVPRTALLLVL